MTSVPVLADPPRQFVAADLRQLRAQASFWRTASLRRRRATRARKASLMARLCSPAGTRAKKTRVIVDHDVDVAYSCDQPPARESQYYIHYWGMIESNWWRR